MGINRIAIALIALATLAPSASTNASAAPARPAVKALVGTDRALILETANIERTQTGMAMLEDDADLDAIATAYATDMADRKFFSHYNPEGRSPFQRMDDARFRYGSAGENIVEKTDERSAAVALVKTEPQRDNLMNAQYRRVGIGIVRASGGIIVVEEFAD